MIGAIIQARMRSTRLPGKVMKKVMGKPLLELLVERLRYSSKLGEIIIGTTLDKRDDQIQDLAEKLSVKYFRGSENDVLDRYYHAARKFKISHIVRITSDCPLIDPEIVDEVISLYSNNGFKYDYVSNTLKPTFPDGLDVEIFSMRVLEKIHKASNKNYQREHVSTYIIENPDEFRMKNYRNDVDLSAHRWTVDNPQDFELIKIIFENLYPEKKNFLMNDILEYLSKNPGLLKINSSIKRNEGFVLSLERDGLTESEKALITETVIEKKKIGE